MASQIAHKEFTDNYIKKRVQKGVYVRTIAPDDDAMIKNYTAKDQEQLRSTKLISAKDFPFSI
jgi:hypothetical protein